MLMDPTSMMMIQLRGVLYKVIKDVSVAVLFRLQLTYNYPAK